MINANTLWGALYLIMVISTSVIIGRSLYKKWKQRRIIVEALDSLLDDGRNDPPGEQKVMTPLFEQPGVTYGPEYKLYVRCTCCGLRHFMFTTTRVEQVWDPRVESAFECPLDYTASGYGIAHVCRGCRDLLKQYNQIY